MKELLIADEEQTFQLRLDFPAREKHIHKKLNLAEVIGDAFLCMILIHQGDNAVFNIFHYAGFEKNLLGIGSWRIRDRLRLR